MINIVLLADHTIGYKLTEYLIENSKDKINIIKIYTNTNNFNRWWTSLHRLEEISPVIVNDYIDFEHLYKDLEKHEIDYILCFSWKHILPKKIINLSKYGVINLHYSLLPNHRGVYPVNWALIEGDNSTGVTIHYIDSSIDTGKIIAQKKVDILPTFTTTELLKKLDEVAFQLFIQIWKKRESWEILSKTQMRKGTYHSYKDFSQSNEINLDKEYKAIDFINYLRGKTFLPHKLNAFFIDKKSKKKVFVGIVLKEEN